ncbi:hypothetical protein LCGC14_3152680, partial [marine sediment metagenome]
MLLRLDESIEQFAHVACDAAEIVVVVERDRLSAEAEAELRLEYLLGIQGVDGGAQQDGGLDAVAATGRDDVERPVGLGVGHVDVAQSLPDVLVDVGCAVALDEPGLFLEPVDQHPERLVEQPERVLWHPDVALDVLDRRDGRVADLPEYDVFPRSVQRVGVVEVVVDAVVDRPSDLPVRVRRLKILAVELGFRDLRLLAENILDERTCVEKDVEAYLGRPGLPLDRDPFLRPGAGQERPFPVGRAGLEFDRAFAEATTILPAAGVDIAAMRREIQSLPPVFGTATE